MASLTLNIDEELLRRARIRALQRGTSVNAVVREYLTSYAGDEIGQQGLRRFLELAERSDATSGASGRSWSRESAHER